MAKSLFGVNAMSFSFEDLSAEEELWFDSVLRDGDSSIVGLGSSPEANEYLEQLEKAYHECGATNIRQAHFFLETKNAVDLQDSRIKALVRRIQELESDMRAALSPDPRVFGRDPDSLISRIEQLERFL